MATDLETFKALLDKAKVGWDETDDLDQFDKSWMTRKTALVVIGHSGARCHFEASFDKAGNIIDIGQYEEL